MSSEVLIFPGIVGSPGFAVGHVYLITHEATEIPRESIHESEMEFEVGRFDAAVTTSLGQIDGLLARMRKESHDGILIVEAHRLMLQDEMLVGRTHEFIRNDRINAEAALERTVKTLDAAFEQLQEPYLKERGGEIRFVGNRIMSNLLGSYRAPSVRVPRGAVVIAHELSPADTLELTSRNIAGFVCEVGGLTSHTAIMARAMEVPAVLGCHGIVDAVANGQMVAIDGQDGLVFLDPDPETMHRTRERRRRHRVRTSKLLENCDTPAVTTDGVRIHLQGNIEYAEEIESLLSHGGEGIGLFRTEYLFVGDRIVPTEDEQLVVYSRVVSEMAPHPVTFRIIDLGGEKRSDAMDHDVGAENPALGLRGIRLALFEEAALVSQLRALMRCAVDRPVRVMLPFVMSVTEIREVRRLMAEAASQLAAEQIPFASNLPLGCMIELPSAAIISDLLAREVDFFSIGTNDLVQYTLAVDRNNDSVATHYNPLHPAVLRLIAQTARAGAAQGIETAICGEMAGDPFNTPLLVGAGLTSLSMNPISVPQVKDVIRRCETKACRVLLEQTLGLTSAEAVYAMLEQFHRDRLGGLVAEV